MDSLLPNGRRAGDEGLRLQDKRAGSAQALMEMSDGGIVLGAQHAPSPLPFFHPGEGSERHQPLSFRNNTLTPSSRAIPVETPVSLSFNGTSHAVMMATPADLQDFAIGFALTQGIIASAAEIESLEIEPIGQGIDCRLWIAPERAEALSKRRRALAGPTGCGVCGVEGIDDALPHVPHVSSAFRPTPQMVMAAIASLPSAQTLGVETRAAHAAGYWTPEAGLVAIREDVGRHNALDKLAGALASPLSREAEEKAGAGLILLTSRVSVEMVQKTAAIGASVLVAVSAPTSLAVQTAARAGIMLIAVARADGFEVFTFPERLMMEAAENAA